MRSELSDNAMAESVRDLVTRRLDDADRWNLALVQRDEVWDEVRMRHLLDSLLAGYPIGAILLCKVKQESRVVQVEGSERVEALAAPDAWQLLDGQQRINALFSILSERGNFGRFYLNMTVPRPAPSPAQTRKSKERVLPHILHQPDGDAEIANRGRCIDLSRWTAWAENRKDIATLSPQPHSIAALLNEIDPLFTHPLDDREKALAATTVRQLIRVWIEPSIPVLRAEVESPLDVLEVFTRINLGGVNVAGIDVYFAGVKTFWTDAEQRVERVLAAAPTLQNRIGALRFISRVASRGLGHGDMLPLSIDRLAGRRGAALRAAMHDITEDGSAVIERLTAFSTWYPASSELGYVLQQVTPELWDEVLGWVAASTRSDSESYDESRDSIDSYLLGATLFGYRNVMGDGFRRLALLEALDAGARAEQFPRDRIIAAARARYQLRGARGRAVPALKTEVGRERLARENGWRLTALAQCIPYSWEPEENFDWDHIYPRGQAWRMWAPGDGRRRHHPDRHLVNSTGNFWALTASANRSLKDLDGRQKFERLAKWASDPDERFKIWPADRWSISREEIDQFIQVSDLLTDEPESIERAMAVFRELVTTRALRLLDEALEVFPSLRNFAIDDTSLLPDDAAASDRGYWQELGMTMGDPRLRSFDTADARKAVEQRAESLRTRLSAELADHAGVARSWPWKHRRPKVGEHLAYELADHNCIELMLRWNETEGATLKVKAYAKYDKASNLYEDFDHIALGAEWGESDERIVAAFLDQVAKLAVAHPR
jgi:hypothetical protein